MVRPKQKPSSKKPKRGVDFKKIKHKVGRKLPPANNATNTQIKSKAIVLPEQSMAAEREGLAVNRRGLTLGELLRQTSHPNANTRKGALDGIRNLAAKHPEELKLHKHAIVEKLRERIRDSDTVVRDTLYNLLKSVIFPSLKEDINGPTILLLMAYIYNAMTNTSVEIRLMAFKFFELVAVNIPLSFSTHAEKVLDYSVLILRNSQIHLQAKLKNVLGGLVQCLSLMSTKKERDNTFNNSHLDASGPRLLHSFEPTKHTKDSEHGFSSAMKKIEELVPILSNCFYDCISLVRDMPEIDAHTYECMLSALQCLNLASRILVQGIRKPQMSFGFHKPLLSEPDFLMGNILVNLQKLREGFPFGYKHKFTEKEDKKFFVLNVKIAEIFLQLSEPTNSSTYLAENFLEFIEFCLLGKAEIPLSKELVEKHLNSILPYMPVVLEQTAGSWNARLLEAFTEAFKSCKVDSKLILGYLSTVKEMLLPENRHTPLYVSSDSKLDPHQIAWVRELPRLLLQSGDRHYPVTKAVLKLLLQIGSIPTLAPEYHQLQCSLKEIFSSRSTPHHDLFLKLPRDCQELAIHCLYYFKNLSSNLVEAVTCRCLCDDLEPLILFRIIDVLQSAYKAGHLMISVQIGILVTLVGRFKVYPDKFDMEDVDKANWHTFKSLTHTVSTYLSQMGDTSLVLKLLWKNLAYEISQKPPMHNMNGLLRMIVALDTRTRKLSDDEIKNLSHYIASYMVDSALYIPITIDIAVPSEKITLFRYLIKPCILLFRGNDKVLRCTLELLNYYTSEENIVSTSQYNSVCPLDASQRLHAVIIILTFLYTDADAKLYRSLSLSTSAIQSTLQNLQNLLDSNKLDLAYEEKNRFCHAFEQLKTRVHKLHGWNRSELE